MAVEVVILVEVGLDCIGASVWLMLSSSPGLMHAVSQTVGPRLVVMVTICLTVLFVVVIVGHGCVGVVAVLGVALAQ